MKLSVTKAARDDLEEIGDDIALHSPNSARRLVKTIQERTREIASFPYAFQELNVNTDLPLRRRVVASYLIIYRIDADRVLILRIVHAARDLARLLEPSG